MLERQEVGDDRSLRSNIVVPGAGHWVQQQEPEAANPALLGFLSEL